MDDDEDTGRVPLAAIILAALLLIVAVSIVAIFTFQYYGLRAA